MKKLIAISTMLALLAGAAFAETQISGSLSVEGALLESMPNDEIGMVSAQLGGSGIKLQVTNDDDTLGGILALNFAKFVSLGYYPAGPWEALHDRAFIWWRPIEQLELFFGKDGDGKFESAGVTRWGFHKGTNGVVPGGEWWWARDYLIGGWDAWGLAISIKPMDMFALHIALTNSGSDGGGGIVQIADQFKAMQIQAVANLDFGNIFVTYQGEDAGDKIGLTFSSGALVDGLNFEVGFNYGLTTEFIMIGLGAEFTMDAFGVRFRAFMDAGGGRDFELGHMNIMPYYDLGMLTAYLNVMIENLVSTADIAVVINPYVAKNLGGGEIRAGFWYNTDSKQWGVPFGISLDF